MAVTRRQFLGKAVTVLGTAGASSVVSHPLWAAPVSGSRLAQANAAQGEVVNGALEPIRKAHDLPALACAVIVDGRTAALGAVGVRKYGTDVKVTVDDQFHIGSCTKAMTATLIGMLIEQGKLNWNTTLAQALPDFTPTMQPELKDVTIEMLLAHRGGFPERSWPLGKTFDDMHQLPGKPREQRQTYVKTFLSEKPAYEPGTKYVYANTGYAILGAIAERTADIAWEDLMAKQLFQPLGMKSAGFGAMGTAEKMDQPWQHVMEGKVHQPVEPGPTSDNPPVIGPGGTVHCNMRDWAKFVTAHVLEGQGEPPLLKPETFKRLHTPPFGGEYAGGWIATERDWGGGRVLSHDGTNNMNYAVVWMAPLKKFAVLSATNQGGAEAIAACDEVASAMIERFL